MPSELDEYVHQPLAPMVDPNDDGLTHINIYSRGKTQLGRWMSNFTHSPFTHPRYGQFASMEAYWYWISTGMQHDDLRRFYGATAKSVGIRHLPVKIDDETFKNHIRDALRLKIAQNKKLCEAMRQSTLPFRHYYVHDGNPPMVNEPKRHLWQMEALEEIRACLKNNEPLLMTDGRRADSGQTIAEVPENPLPPDLSLPPAEED